jgi:hypothetical protein
LLDAGEVVVVEVPEAGVAATRYCTRSAGTAMPYLLEEKSTQANYMKKTGIGPTS